MSISFSANSFNIFRLTGVSLIKALDLPEGSISLRRIDCSGSQSRLLSAKKGARLRFFYIKKIPLQYIFPFYLLAIGCRHVGQG